MLDNSRDANPRLFVKIFAEGDIDQIERISQACLCLRKALIAQAAKVLVHHGIFYRCKPAAGVHVRKRDGPVYLVEIARGEERC